MVACYTGLLEEESSLQPLHTEWSSVDLQFTKITRCAMVARRIPAYIQGGAKLIEAFADSLIK
jgi:hypothetical protein